MKPRVFFVHIAGGVSGRSFRLQPRWPKFFFERLPVMFLYTIVFLKNGVVSNVVGTSEKEPSLMTLKEATRLAKRTMHMNAPARTRDSFTPVIVPVRVKMRHVKPPKGVAVPLGGNRRRQRSAAAAAGMN